MSQYVWTPTFWRMRTLRHSVVIVAPDHETAKSVAAAWLIEQKSPVFEFDLNRIKSIPAGTPVIAGVSW